jgi:MazG family protein
MQEPSAVGRIVELVRDLRQRCPWDAAQTPETLRPYLVEEVLELDHAIGEADDTALRGELGDVLLHLAFQIVLAEERGAFGAEDLTRRVEEKMWARHPHLFPAHLPTTPRQVRPTPKPTEAGEAEEAEEAELHELNRRWERAKLLEMHPSASVLDGLPPTLPALVMAFRLQEKAAGVGFDWPSADGPREKVHEELAELEAELVSERERSRLNHEIGDLLFAIVNLARKLEIDPRAALEGANRRFGERFRRVEALARERGLELGRASLEELDGLWEEVKSTEAQRQRGTS